MITGLFASLNTFKPNASAYFWPNFLILADSDDFCGLSLHTKGVA
jgi:hypothetical protein